MTGSWSARRWPSGQWAAGLLVAAAVLAGALSAGPVPAATLERELAGIHERARAAAESRDWETVERLRLERARILANADEASPWVDARKALAAVDGDGKNPGLVERLRYKEASQRLLDAWKPFASVRDGPVFGDVAVRLFQVGQQAVAVHRDALTPGSPGEVVSEEIVRAAIEAAVARDPCQLEARAIQVFMRPDDRKETFLRLEVRPELRALNAGLLDLSWPGSGVVLPHHAPVEFMKALLTHRLVTEERYGDFLAPEQFNAAGKAGSGFVLKGVDARSAPFRLMYGRFFLMEVADEAGKPTSAFVYLDSKGEWDKKYLRLLYRKPDELEARQPAAAFFVDFFGSMRPSATWSLGPHEFALYDLPIERAGQIIERDLPKICVRKASGIARGRFSRTNNDLDFLVDQLERDPFPSHPKALARMAEFVAANDRTNHALIDLTGLRPGERSTDLNPLIVMSTDDRVRPEVMFKREGSGGRPFLSLDDAAGSRLEFHEDTKELVVRYAGVDGHVPMSIDAIPDPLMLSTPAGKLLEAVLVDCGYTKEQANVEIRKAFKDPRYIPPKFADVVQAKQRSRKGSGANAGQLAMEMLKQKGWAMPWLPGEDFQLVYRVYGFRYLTDSRGTIVTNPGLSLPLGPDGSPAAPATRRLEFRPPDGRKAIDESQVYTEADYAKLRGNMANEFLPAMVALHPCLRGLDRGPYGLPPDAKEPAKVPIPDGFLDEGGASKRVQAEGAEAEAARRNRLFTEYARGMLAAARDRATREHLLAMHLLSARQSAKTGHHHRAIVSYNELVRLVAADETGDVPLFQFDLFDRVPTPQDLEAFAKTMTAILEDQKRLVLLQAEHAAVLRAAGLRESASFLFRRLHDQFVHYMLPAIDLSEKYARSYAFSGGAELAKTRKRIQEYLDTIAKASAGVRKKAEFRTVAAEPGRDDAAVAAAIGEIEKRFQELSDLAPSLAAWARAKAACRREAPHLLYRGSFVVNPVQLCPATYEPDRGFRTDVEALFPDDLAERLVEWARRGDAEATKDQRSGENHFLLGWYWLERGNSDFAWTSFIEAAKAFDAGADEDDLAALVRRRNAMMMLVAAASVVEMPPGVSAVKTDFVDGLRGQAILWERTWVAKRHDGGHARAQREAIDEFAGLARLGIRRAENSEAIRYFFPDHTFRHGPLPDILVDDASRMKLFDSVPRDAEDRPIDKPPPVEKKKAAAADQAADEKKEPEIPPRELTFEALLDRFYTFPDAIDPDILRLSGS